MMKTSNMFFNKETLLEKNKKTREYKFKITNENLNEFYEELFKFLFENNDTQKLDNFLLIAHNRLEEFIEKNYYYQSDET